jgi:hypothetical protein
VRHHSTRITSGYSTQHQPPGGGVPCCQHLSIPTTPPTPARPGSCTTPCPSFDIAIVCILAATRPCRSSAQLYSQTIRKTKKERGAQQTQKLSLYIQGSSLQTGSRLMRDQCIRSIHTQKVFLLPHFPKGPASTVDVSSLQPNLHFFLLVPSASSRTQQISPRHPSKSLFPQSWRLLLRMHR